jgi:hypothetical protein
LIPWSPRPLVNGAEHWHRGRLPSLGRERAKLADELYQWFLTRAGQASEDRVQSRTLSA